MTAPWCPGCEAAHVPGTPPCWSSRVEYPVVIEVVRECQFKAKTCGYPIGKQDGVVVLCDQVKTNRVHSKREREAGTGHAFKRRNGCAYCGRPKGDRAHFGEPPSLNFFATGNLTGPVLSSMKQAWQALFVDLLADSGLPHNLDRVLVEGEITFPKAAKRDQGNFRIIPEKALGDALQEGRYIANDDWAHYEFGNLRRRVEPGVSATRLMIFALDPEPEQEPPQMELTV